jgi:hypothetical protein
MFWGRKEVANALIAAVIFAVVILIPFPAK